MRARSASFVSLLVLIGCGSQSKPPAPSADNSAPETGLVQIAALPGAMAPNLAAGASKTVLVTWLEKSDAGHRLRLARISPSGLSQPQTVVESERLVANWADVPAVHERDGRLVVTWLERSGPGDGHAYDAMAAESTDGGQSFRLLGALHDDNTQTEHGFVSLTWSDNSHWAAWLDGRQTAHSGPMSLRASAVGAGEPGHLVDEKVCDCCPTTMVSTPTGPLIAYRDRSDDEVRDISVVRFDGSAWSEPQRISADNWIIEGCPVNGPSAAAQGDRVAIAWYTEGGDRPRVMVAHSQDGGRSFAAPVELTADQPGRPLGRVHIAMDGAGDVLVAWLQGRDDSDRASLLVRRSDGAGRIGPVRTITEVAGNRQSGVPRLLMAGDQIILAWTRRDQGDGGAVELARLAGRDVAAVRASNPAPESPPPSSAADSLELQAFTEDGSQVSLADLRGQVVLVNVWATWCAPCREEMPHLIELDQTYRDRGLQVIGLSVDDADLQPQVAAMAAEIGLTFPVWLDPEQTSQTILGTQSLPVTVVVDRQGQVVFRRDGTITADDRELTSALEQALARPAR